MATSRPIRKSEWLTYLTGHHIGGNRAAGGDEHPPDFVLQSDFGLDVLNGNEYRSQVCMRVFGLQPSATDASLAAAITNGTAPGLYVREGDDTSDWETYRQVLARRVEEAMAARRGGAGGGETAAKTATARQDDEIRVGDVVEVVSCSDTRYTRRDDIGGGGRVTQRGGYNVQLTPVDGLRLPSVGIAGLADVRKVTSPSPSSPQTVAVNFSPMPDGEAARIEVAITDEVRRRSVVDDMRRATSRDFTAAAITDYLQSLGATQIHVNQAPGRLPVVEVAGLSQQAFDTARQNLPVGIQLRAAGGVVGRRVDVPTADANRRPVPATAGVYIGPATPQQPTQPPSRFSLLEVDTDPSADVKAHEPQALKAPVDLAALQAELRAEREAKRALAAAQTPPGRFDLLECDLPAVPASVAVKPAKVPPQRPAVTSPPSKPRNPVETITDLTTARSPLELARMLEGLNDELSTMMRQREAN